MKRRTLLKSLVVAPLVALITSASAVANVPPEFSEFTPRVADPDQGWQIVEVVTVRNGGKGGGMEYLPRHRRSITEYNYFAVHLDHNIPFNLKDTGKRIDGDDLERRYAEVLAWKRRTREE